MRKTVSVLGLTVVAVLAGCSSSGPDGSSSQSAVAVPAGSSAPSYGATAPAPAGKPQNPVTLLKTIDGCQLADGVESGEIDINGNRYATCSLSGETVEVETRCFTTETLGAGLEQAQSTDDQKVIVVPEKNCLVTVRNVDGSPLPKATAESVASDVGGTVRPAAA